MTAPCTRLRGVRVCPENQDALSKWLDRVNEKACEHVFKPCALLKLAQDAERRLDGTGLSKAARRGALFYVQSGTVMPKSYRYQRIVNVAALRRGARDWSLVKLTRDMAWPNGQLVNPCSLGLRLTPEQNVFVAEALRKRYRVLSRGAVS